MMDILFAREVVLVRTDNLCVKTMSVLKLPHNLGSEKIFVLVLVGCVSLFMKCRFKITYNEQGLAKFGHLLLCPPGTEVATRRNVEFSYGDQS
jgi:hypothetical protein